MFNVTVIKLRDLIKYFIIIIIILLMIFFSEYFFKKNNLLRKLDIGNKVEMLLDKYTLYIINEGLPITRKIK